MKNYIVIFFIYAVAFLVSSMSFSKEMPRRLGIGIKDNTSESIPSLAAVYNVGPSMAVTGGLGIDTKKDYSTSQINAGVRYIIFHESQLHFYSGGQLALVTLENPVDQKNTGFEANLIFGTEFFFTGLENVGFSFEGGVGLSTIKNSRVRTIADHPLKAGIIFYF